MLIWYCQLKFLNVRFVLYTPTKELGVLPSEICFFHFLSFSANHRSTCTPFMWLRARNRSAAIQDAVVARPLRWVMLLDVVMVKML